MRLNKDFFGQDALVVAPSLIGKLIVRKYSDGKIRKFRITETEAYRGEEDTACHAKAGKTERTKVLYNEGGFTYIYLCYGIHNLLNIVTGEHDHPQGVLIRGIEGYSGPGRVTKILELTRELNSTDVTKSDEVWIEDDGYVCEYTTSKRVGIEYATEPYKSIEWRYIIKDKS
jgi:DNA-3-methyladenine glycosylase